MVKPRKIFDVGEELVGELVESLNFHSRFICSLLFNAKNFNCVNGRRREINAMSQTVERHCLLLR